MNLLKRLLPRILVHKYRLIRIAVISLLTGFLGAFSLLAVKPLIEVMFDDGPGVALEQTAPERTEAPGGIPIPEKFAAKIEIYKGLVTDYVGEHKERAKAWMLEHKVQSLFIVGVVLIVISALNSCLTYLVNVMTARVGLDVLKKLKDDLFAHILAMDLHFFTKNSTGQMMARLQNDTRKVQAMLLAFTGTTFVNFFKVIALLVLLIYLSPKLTLYAAITLPLAGCLFYFTGKKIRRISERAERDDAGVFQVSQEALSGVRLVKALGTEDFERDRFDQATHQWLGRLLKFHRIKGFIGPANDFLSTLAIVLTLVIGGSLFLGDRNYLGDEFGSAEFTIYLLAITRFYRPLKSLLKLNVTYQRGMASLIRIYRIMDLVPAVVDAEDAVDLPADQPAAIHFNRVSFSYPRRHHPERVINELELTVAPREVVAVVGHSGAGKTTLMNLLCRFYDVEAGAILIDGHDVRAIHIQSLRDRVSIVPQETFLFDDTVYANIAYGSKGATREQAEKAARQAKAHEFIMAMPKQYDSVVGERGAKLSTGQKQRLAIARALVKDPTILIFDEATASLDAETEHQIRESLREMVVGRTTFLIAHRFSTVMMADRILVLDDGRVAEEGTHASLYEAGGLYTRLCQYQGIFVDSPPEEAISIQRPRAAADVLD